MVGPAKLVLTCQSRYKIFINNNNNNNNNKRDILSFLTQKVTNVDHPCVIIFPIIYVIEVNKA
jgi:hypothetical protein